MEYKIEKEVVYKVAGRYFKSEEEAKKAIEYREITQKMMILKHLSEWQTNSNKLCGMLIY